MTDDATYDELMRDLLGEQAYLLECSRLGIVARMHRAVLYPAALPRRFRGGQSMTDDKSCFCPNCEQAAARIEALVKENAGCKPITIASAKAVRRGLRPQRPR